MNHRLILRILFLSALLLLATACSDDPTKPEPGIKFETRTIGSSEYLNNRFFRLDRPDDEANGRDAGEFIDPASIRVFELQGAGPHQPEDVSHISVYVDATGFGDWGLIDTAHPFEFGPRWRLQSDIEAMRDELGVLIGIDMGRDVGAETVLACTYDIVDADGELIARVGDNPAIAPPTTEIVGSEELHYMMKLLKAPANRPVAHVFGYVWRNIYSLGVMNIDASTFDLRIEDNMVLSPDREKDEQGVDYIRIFGLDSEDVQGAPGADGIVDKHNPRLFDLARGLLRFPFDFPEPFAATPQQYEANVDSPEWEWDPRSFLGLNPAPELYDYQVLPSEYYQYRYFRIVAEYRVYEP